MEMCRTNFDKLRTFYIAMVSVASHIDDCSVPIDIWRIKKDCIEKDIMEKIKAQEKGVSPKANAVRRETTDTESYIQGISG